MGGGEGGCGEGGGWGGGTDYQFGVTYFGGDVELENLSLEKHLQERNVKTKKERNKSSTHTKKSTKDI